MYSSWDFALTDSWSLKPAPWGASNLSAAQTNIPPVAPELLTVLHADMQTLWCSGRELTLYSSDSRLKRPGCLAVHHVAKCTCMGLWCLACGCRLLWKTSRPWSTERDGVICYWYNLLTTDPNKNTYQLVFLCLHFYIYTVEELPLQSLTRDVYLSICIANLPCGVVFWIEVFSEVFSECLRNVVRFWATEDSPLNHSWKILAWS